MEFNMKKIIQILFITAVYMVQTSQCQEKQKAQPLTPMQSIFVGGMTGAGEVIPAGQTCTYFKNIRQAKRMADAKVAIERKTMREKAKFHARQATKGLGINLTAMFPTTIVQKAVFDAQTNPQSTKTDKIKAAAVAGAASAVVSGPVEMGIAQKMVHGRSVGEIFRTYGPRAAGRGAAGTAARDAIFTVGYKAAIEPTAEALEECGIAKPIAEKVAPTAVGAGVAAATQAVDTVKTTQQLDLAKTKYKGFAQTAHTIWKEGGIRALHSGGVPRAIRVMLAVNTMPEIERMITEQIQKS